jgi:hypothetical protein
MSNLSLPRHPTFGLGQDGGATRSRCIQIGQICGVNGCDYGGGRTAGGTSPTLHTRIAFHSPRYERRPPSTAIAGLETRNSHEPILTMLQHASRNTRSSGAICLQMPTQPPRSTACASLRPTRLSPSHGSGTSLASSARSRRPTARSSP